MIKLQTFGNVPDYAKKAAHNVFNLLPKEFQDLLDKDKYKITLADRTSKDAYDYLRSKYKSFIGDEDFRFYRNFPHILTEPRFNIVKNLFNNQWESTHAFNAHPIDNDMFKWIPYNRTPKQIHDEIYSGLAHEIGHAIRNHHWNDIWDLNHILGHTTKKLNNARYAEGNFSKHTNILDDFGKPFYKTAEEKNEENFAELMNGLMRWRWNKQNEKNSFLKDLSDFTSRLAEKKPRTANAYYKHMYYLLEHSK